MASPSIEELYPTNAYSIPMARPVFEALTGEATAEDGATVAAITRQRRISDALVAVTQEPTMPNVADFELELPGESLVDPKTNVGYVSSIEKVTSVDNRGRLLPCDVFEIRIRDPFIDADPDTYSAVNNYISRLELLTRRHGFDPMTHGRSEANSAQEQNPFTQAWLAHPRVESLGVWRNLVPNAEALHYLRNPYVGLEIADRDGNKSVISTETAAQIRFVDDAIGIRDRGTAMSYLLAQHLAGGESQNTADELHVLSLASGTAEPAILAGQEAQRTTGRKVSLTVADIDERSLSFVRQNAEQYGFGGNLATIRANILNKQLKQYIDKLSGRGNFDVVENMGFEEYLPQEGDELAAFKGKKLPQASDFTRNAFELVKPGGVLLSGNMVLDRDQVGFIFGIVDWPLINARSEQSILRIYEKAGLLNNSNVKIEMFRVIDDAVGTHVYNIVKATKLA